jgi:hypothetical protein
MIYRLYRLGTKLTKTIKTMADDNNFYRLRQLLCEIRQFQSIDDKTIKLPLSAWQKFTTQAHQNQESENHV